MTGVKEVFEKQNSAMKCEWVIGTGGGVNWLSTEAIPKVNKLKPNPGDNIVIWLGVNDYHEEDVTESYATVLNQQCRNDWRDYNVFVCEVGYVDAVWCNRNHQEYVRLNKTGEFQGAEYDGIATFNKELKKQLSQRMFWIDINSELGLTKSNKSTDESLWVEKEGNPDGLFYAEELCTSVLEAIVKQLTLD